MTHVLLTESSVSYRVVTHDRKGREGKGREIGGGNAAAMSPVVVSGSTSIDLTVGVGTAPEEWMLEDLDLLNGDGKSHAHCTACQPVASIPALSTFIALCGRKALARTDRARWRPNNACPECVKMERQPCMRCGA